MTSEKKLNSDNAALGQLKKVHSSVNKDIGVMENLLSDLGDASAIQNNFLESFLKSQQYIADASTKQIDTWISICKVLITVLIPVLIAAMSIKSGDLLLARDTILETSLAAIIISALTMTKLFIYRSKVLRKYKRYHDWVMDKMSNILDVSHSKAKIVAMKNKAHDISEELESIEESLKGKM